MERFVDFVFEGSVRPMSESEPPPLPELRACPFCGDREGLELKDFGDALFYVECGNCSAQGPVFADDEYAPGEDADIELDAANAWNERAEPLHIAASEGERS